jgi:uncharacterized protein YqgC (DUF456 family)
VGIRLAISAVVASVEIAGAWISFRMFPILGASVALLAATVFLGPWLGIVLARVIIPSSRNASVPAIGFGSIVGFLVGCATGIGLSRAFGEPSFPQILVIIPSFGWLLGAFLGASIPVWRD